MKHVDFDGTGRLSYARQALTDLDVRILVRPDDLTPSAQQIIAGEYLVTGNKRGWSVRLQTDGVLRVTFSNNGTTVISKDSTASITTVYSNGDKFWLRYVLDVNNGAAGYDVKFYYSDDGEEWTQLGSTVTTATATSIFSDAANVITMGGEGTAATYTGKVYKIHLMSTIGGTTNLVDEDPWDWSTATYGATGVTTVTPAIAVTEQDVYPTRLLISGTDLEEDDSVSFYRVRAGTRTAVRGAENVVPGDPSLVRIDAEIPFGVPISYVMVLNEEEEYTTSPDTYTLEGGKVAITDAITGQAAEVEILAWPEKRYERPASTFTVGGRHVAVIGLRPGFGSTIEIETTTDAARENFTNLLEAATSGILQIRQDGTYEDIDCYVAVLVDVARRRDNTDGADERRIWALDVLEVEPWASDIRATGYTLQDIADAYVGLTLADIADDFTSLLDIALGDFGV